MVEGGRLHFKCLPFPLIFSGQMQEMSASLDLAAESETTRFLGCGKSRVQVENQGPHFSDKDFIRVGRIFLNSVYKNVKCFSHVFFLIARTKLEQILIKMHVLRKYKRIYVIFIDLTWSNSLEKTVSAFFIGKLMRNCSLLNSLKPKTGYPRTPYILCLCKEQSVLPDTNMSPVISPLIASLLLLFCLALLYTNATITDSDTIRPGQSLNTSEYIQSANGKYKLGFFSTENSTKYYVATFYSNTTENVAVIANREHPFPNPSAVLTFDPDGNLVISDGRLLHVLTNTSGGNDTYARLLDTGNFILTNRASGVLWQSFDYPTDILLPGMKLKDANDHPVLRSWKSQKDPAPGLFSLHLGSGKTQIILMEGSEPYWTSSLITGVLAGILVIERDYITWRSKNINETRRIVLDLYGHLLMQTWMEGDQGWSSQKLTTCGAYPVCGVSSICDETADADSRCYCLPGFTRESTFAGCKRKTDSHCSDNIDVQKDWFLPIPQVYLPRNPLRLDVGKASECESTCLNNCSCTGYAYDQEHRCLVWDGPLQNLKQFPADKLYETEFYLKLAPNFTEG
jgi:hypothetical protein